MSHNIFNERFFSLRQPAWHGLGLVSEEEMTAYEIFTQKMTSYDITLEPVYTEVGNMKLELHNKVITRHPVPDDPCYRSFGIVGPDYTIIDPLRTMEIWDETTKKFPETLGVLGQGESIFITTKLPTFDIKGDEVESYLMLHNPYGGGAVDVRVTPVRVVCQNTLVAAKNVSTESFRIIHDSKVEKRLSRWMTGIVQRAEYKSAVLRDAFTLMSDTMVDDEIAADVLTRIYVDPKRPNYVPDASVMKRREAAYEATVKRNEQFRTYVLEGWQGLGTGMDLQSSQGTAWGLYNSVVEVEDYRPTNLEESRFYNSLFGDRAQRKELAYAEVLDYARTSQT